MFSWSNTILNSLKHLFTNQKTENGDVLIAESKLMSCFVYYEVLSFALDINQNTKYITIYYKQQILADTKKICSW